jgi:hypothetical protein
MAFVHGLGIRGCSVLLLAHAIACSDDGVAATSDDPSGGGTTGTATMSGTDSATMTGTTAESSLSDTSPESTGPGTSATTADDTSGTTTTADTSGTGSSTDGESSTGEPLPCDGPRDCQVVDTCCDCAAIPADAEPPMCEENCEQSMCAALGITPVAQCDAGSCEVVDGAAQTCDDCGEDEVCVQNVAQMVTVMCIPLPRDCGGTPTCECMGEVCQAPFDVCNDDGEGIDCICIAC